MNPQIELSEIREMRFTMKILQVNSVCGVTGTGRIVTDLYDAAVNNGHDCIIAYGEHKFHNDPGNRKTIEIGRCGIAKCMRWQQDFGMLRDFLPVVQR